MGHTHLNGRGNHSFLKNAMFRKCCRSCRFIYFLLSATFFLQALTYVRLQHGEWALPGLGRSPRATAMTISPSVERTSSSEEKLFDKTESQLPTHRSNWHLVTYAEQQIYADTQKKFDLTFERSGCSTHEKWSMSRLRQTIWFKKHSALWEEYSKLPRGDNLLWAWKPFIILEKLTNVPENDWVFYTDSSKYYTDGFADDFEQVRVKLERMARENHGCTCIPAVRLRQSLEWEFAQKCSLKNGATLCEALRHVAPTVSCLTLRNHPMVQASWSLWRNDFQTRNFVGEWSQLMMTPSFTRGLPFDDQSALGLLLHSRNMKTLWWPEADLLKWNELSVANKERVYPGGGAVKCGTCKSFVDAIRAGQLTMVLGNASVAPGDWRPAPLTKANLCGGENPWLFVHIPKAGGASRRLARARDARRRNQTRDGPAKTRDSERSNASARAERHNEVLKIDSRR